MATFLVLFDVDGTLVHTHGAGKRALALAFERVFGVDSFESRTSEVAYAGRTDPLIVTDLAGALGIVADRLEDQRGVVYEAYYEALREEMDREDPRREVLPGVLALLEELERRDDVLTGLLTGNLERGARIKLAYFDLNRFFPDGGFASDHQEREQIARLAVEKLSRRTGTRFEPSRVRVVGDTEHDVQCARANGYRAVAVHSGWAPLARLERSRPDALLQSLEDLPSALDALLLESPEGQA